MENKKFNKLKPVISKKDLPDDLNPEYLFTGTWTGLLIQIAKGTIDCQGIAKKTLANRGLDINGKWVGFNKA